MVPSGALENIQRAYDVEAKGCDDPAAQKRVEDQQACIQFTAMVDTQRAQWIPVHLDKADGFDTLPSNKAELCLNEKIKKLPPLSAQKVQEAFANLQGKITKSNTFTPVSDLISKFCLPENDATAALLLLGFEARHNNSGNFQFKAKVISAG